MPLTNFFKPTKSITPDKVQNCMEKSGHCSSALLDVRQPKEYEHEHIVGAKLIPLPDLVSRLTEINTKNDVIIYCTNEVRSIVAAKVLSNNGFREVLYIKGGIKAWGGYMATGPHDFHMRFCKETETTEKLLQFVYDMEMATSKLYLDLQKRTTDKKLAILCEALAGYETDHKKQLMIIYDEMGLNIPLLKEAKNSLIKGGFIREKFLIKNEKYLKTIHDLLSIAMMLETQSLDLYLRLANEPVCNNIVKEFLFRVAQEEIRHLDELKAFLERESIHISAA